MTASPKQIGVSIRESLKDHRRRLYANIFDHMHELVWQQMSDRTRDYVGTGIYDKTRLTGIKDQIRPSAIEHLRRLQALDVSLPHEPR